MKPLVIISLVITMSSQAQTNPLLSFKKSTVKIEKTPFDIYKGTIRVKLNRKDSSSTSISLPVYVVKSSSPSPAEPIYWMEGGPGSTNLKLPFKAFLANHDVVFIGYRGVDGCPFKKSKKLIKAFRGLDHQLFSDKSLDNIGKAIKQYAEDIAKSGIDINNFTIIDVVDDFEEVRKQLGHQKIVLYSASYGTRVALLYSYRYPEAIKRSLMVGINPPGRCVWYPENSTRIVRAYDSIYKAQKGTVDISIEESIKQSFARMPKRWGGFKLDAGKIKVSTFFLMFDKNMAVMAFDAYRRAALKNDYSGLYLMQLAFNYSPQMIYGDLFSKAASADFDLNTDYRKVFSLNKEEIGAPATLLFWGMSKNWPIKLIIKEYRKTRISNTETLMISGNLDITDPPQVPAEELLPYMPNGKQVILNDSAHYGNMVYQQYEAFTHMAVRFIDEGAVDTTKFKHHPVDFKPKKSFNKMAKVLYPVVCILSWTK